MADNPLFHNGDLQSGIARAIKERKVVACFVRQDGDHWSQIWEDYWLSNNSHPTDMISDDQPPLGLIIADHAVLLRLDFGSKEAGFLAAFVKVEKAPTLVVIKDGKVLEKLEGGIGREDFVERLIKAVGYDDGPVAPGDTLFDQEEEEELLDDIGGRQMRPDEPISSTPAQHNTANQPQPSSSTTSSQPPQRQQLAQAQTLLAERAQRLELERIKREAAEKTERLARAKAKRREEEEAAAAAGDEARQRATTERGEKERARDAWIYQQKQRKDEAKQERQRILAQIENDKQERKAQALRKKEEEQSTGSGASSDLPAAASPFVAKPASLSALQWCNLQVRLFDGSSLRGRFASDADVATAVRTWVKEASPAGGADIPYNFRQILAPQPSRTIEVGEETKSLLELGLVPSATLVLVPVAGATDAYSGAGRGYMSSALHAAYWVANTAYGFVGSALSYVPGFGTATSGPYMGGVGDEKEQSNVEGARMADADSMSQTGGSIRVKTLADQRKDAEKAQQGATFYNGNSSAFQGRKDDEDE
jgi:hypothetical protein